MESYFFQILLVWYALGYMTVLIFFILDHFIVYQEAYKKGERVTIGDVHQRFLSKSTKERLTYSSGECFVVASLGVFIVGLAILLVAYSILRRAWPKLTKRPAAYITRQWDKLKELRLPTSWTDDSKK